MQQIKLSDSGPLSMAFESRSGGEEELKVNFQNLNKNNNKNNNKPKPRQPQREIVGISIESLEQEN